MDNNNNNCSFKDHKEIPAITYCDQCKIYMCFRCAEYHKGLLEKHHSYGLDTDIKEIFTGFCKEENHTNELEYFCRTHNKLCCIACITKIKGEGKGQHTDCEVCFIKDIKEEKKNKLKENIHYLEKLSITLDKSVNDLKSIYENINKNKEEIKIKIQKLFTKIRNALNKREDQLLLKVNQIFENFYFNKDIIKESEKLPNQIKISLDKGKSIDSQWDDENIKLNSLINDCLNIEKNINDINILNENVKKYNIGKNITINLSPREHEINDFLETIKSFGKIYYNDFKYRLKHCPIYINENRKYTITGEKENIFTKIGSSCQFIGTICEDALDNLKEHRWKINILNSQNKLIMVGVAPIDFDINSSSYNNGWFFYCYNSTLYSGKPHNYNNKKSNLSKVKDTIEIIMDMNKGSLKFIIDNEDKGESFTDIPLDKPLAPAILLYDKNDSIEITEI